MYRVSVIKVLERKWKTRGMGKREGDVEKKQEGGQGEREGKERQRKEGIAGEEEVEEEKELKKNAYNHNAECAGSVSLRSD